METMEPKKTTKKRGRPKGSKTTNKVTQTVSTSRCPKCDSTERTPYIHQRLPLIHNGRTNEGKPFTHVVWRLCTCRSCGQNRIDKEFLYAPTQEEIDRK